MADIAPDWRIVDGVATAWYGASSPTGGAALAARLPEGVAVDVRANGVRVRVDSDEQAEAVSAAARDLGLAADPAALQQVAVVVEATDPAVVAGFWQRVLDYAPGPDGGLADPLRRDPALRIRPATEARPLRNRIHLDVVRPAAAVEQVDAGPAGGPFGVRHADADGNEVDLVPGGPVAGGPATADWQAVFSAIACYRTTSAAQQRDLATAAAALTEKAGFPLLIDVRPGLVVLDSGKDRWEADAHGLEVDFPDLAGQLQTAAHDLGATADLGPARCVQVFLDAADVAAVRAFWVAALGYELDRRSWVTDIHDPRWLGPPLSFQELDGSDAERRRQRNRLHVELAVPADAAPARLATILAAGGRLLDESAGRWHVADPEDNELVLLAG